MAGRAAADGEGSLERTWDTATTALTTLAVLGVVAALHLMQAILIPVALALLLSCLLSPATKALRRVLPLGATGAALVLFLTSTVFGLYLASLTAENIVQALHTLPADAEQLSGRVSRQLADLVHAQPGLARILPDPSTIDLLGDRNRAWLIRGLSDRLGDLSGWVGQGLIVLILVLFLLAESEMLMPRVVRFFAGGPGEANSAERTLKVLIRQVRAYLVARTVINAGLGAVVALSLWLLGVKFPVALGAFAAVTNFIPYVGQVIGGALPVLVTLGQSEQIGDALIVAAVFLAVVTVEGYVVTPYIMGRSLDMNGTTVLLACLFWGFLWGLVGLILAIPITVTIKLVCQHVPSLQRWAELMSRDWVRPGTKPAPAVEVRPPPAPVERLPVPAPASPIPEPSLQD